MRFDTLKSIEANFLSESASLLTPFSVDVPNEDLTLHGQVFKPKQTDYFHADERKKERIVLHFTAGNVRSDIMSLTQPKRHVSVSFVIGRDGTVYLLFPSKFWSGHLGEGVGNQKGTGNPQDKATIGIELSNYGYLVPRDGNLETIYSRVKDVKTGKISPVDLYCPLTNTQAYTKIEQPFRKQSFYASYTPQQLDSLIVLLRFLTSKYNIPRQFLPDNKRFLTTEEVLNFRGIVSHINYRSENSGKWDIGPAFDWATVMTGVQAAKYVSAFPVARSLSNELTSEEAIEELFPLSKDITAAEEEATDNEGYNPNDFEEQPLTKEVSPKKLYALLVGIDKYDKIRKLSGCVNDVRAIESYLEISTDFAEKDIKKLTDADASRAKIIDAFRTHLSQAKKTDTVLFYYSGHGTQEEADAIWKDETDGGLECIVCHDGNTQKASEFLLTDKELRFLISEVAQKTDAHIVTIFDCCHSGDNTRNAGSVEASYKDVNERRVLDRGSRFFPKRAWDEFFFSTIIKTPTADLPQGTHIQMAACESNQTALEIAGEGVFTKKLLKVLKDCGGNISYNTLRTRLRQYMRAGFEQTPRVYIPIEAEKLLNTGFMNRLIEPQKMICEAVHTKELGWQLNVGAIHGVEPGSVITLFTPSQPPVRLTAKVRVNGIFIDYTLIETEGLDAETIYRAEVVGLLTQELKLEFKNSDVTPNDAQKLMEDLQVAAAGGFSFGGEKAGIATEKDSGRAEPADYTLHLRSGEAYLTLPNDPYRPLIRPIPLLKEDGNSLKDNRSEVISTLQHVSRWHFIKNLQNRQIPDNFPLQPLKIEITRVLAAGTTSPVDISNETAVLEYEKAGGKWKGSIAIKVTNTTEQDLYFCAAYLSKEFQCFLDFLPTRVHLLEAGASILLGQTVNTIKKDRINLTFGKVEQEYNWPQTVEAIKFIISTTLFDPEALTLEELPKPLTTDDINKGTDKGLATTEDDDPVEFSGWITQTIQLIFKNPVYNIIQAETLKKLLEWEETAYFAAGLYCDVNLESFDQPAVWTLKDTIDVVVPEDEKGLLGTVAMFLGNQIETAQRRKQYRNLKKDLSRTVIVAEGDSWFQYPLKLQDTLDQLYKHYAILSFAEAGDTLENYLKKREYIDAIGTEKAAFFLVSGGGNDIIGEEFPGFLRETPDLNDATPQRYLNETFATGLDKLESFYVEMFTELIKRYPDLHILVHCYDYVIPVDSSISNAKSWSGKHMVSKGIAPQEEREKLIRHILDKFAGKLQGLVKKFSNNLSFVDTRGLVKRDLWSDEIHPKNEGFELVADKFIKEIERIKAIKKS